MAEDLVAEAVDGKYYRATEYMRYIENGIITICRFIKLSKNEFVTIKRNSYCRCEKAHVSLNEIYQEMCDAQPQVTPAELYRYAEKSFSVMLPKSDLMFMDASAEVKIETE